MIAKIKAEVGCDDMPVYATGGWGKTIARKTSLIDKYDPFLTLRGIRLVALNGGVSTNASDSVSDFEEEETLLYIKFHPLFHIVKRFF